LRINEESIVSHRFGRREFVAGAGAAVVSTTLSRGLFASGPVATPGNFKKAVKIGMVQPGKTILEKMTLLKELGFDGVELDSPGPYSVEDVKKAMEATGLIVPGVVDSVHWNDRLSDPKPETRKKGLDALLGALQYCKDIGGTSVLLVPGKVTPDAPFKECFDRSVAEIKKATPTAEKLGIEILIENVWNDFLTDPKTMAEFIDACESKMVGAHFDVGNTLRYSPSHEWVPILGKRIKKLDIKDWSKDKRGFGAELLEGDADWPKVMAELKKIGYEGWGTAEIAGGDREWLKETAERMDKIFAL
jgi:L-ribulose-5-phosphate 3-epimerase